MRTLTALQAALLLSLCAGACGGAGGRAAGGAPKTPAPSAGTVAASNPAADRGRGDYDTDDAQPVDDDRQTVRTYGREAPSADEQAIAALVKRYFAAAAAHDGARACALIDPGFARTIPKSYGQLGPSYLHGGKTCAAVLSMLFGHYRAELAAKRGVSVPGVRLEGAEGFALLDFPDMPERQIAIGRHGAGWRIEALLDGPMRPAP